MGKQTIRQRARRQALDVAARHRRERLVREKRLQGLAASAIAVVLERDQFVASADRRIGESLRQMTEVEGLTLREAIEWCGGGLTRQEATRLRHLARRGSHEHDPDDAQVADPAAAAGAGAGDGDGDAPQH